MESEFGSLRDSQGDPTRRICSVALDDLKVSSRSYEDPVREVNLVLDKATDICAEFSVAKCAWAAEEVEYWGFLLSAEGRRPTPGKVRQLSESPEYEGLEDIRSHVHFCEYLKIFCVQYRCLALPKIQPFMFLVSTTKTPY